MCKGRGMPDPQDLIGSAEAERILNISRATLTRWIAAGRIPLAGQLPPSGRGAFIFNRSDVERLAAELKASA